MARPEREVSIVVHLVHFLFSAFLHQLQRAAYYFFFLSYIHRESILVKINKKKISERKREREEERGMRKRSTRGRKKALDVFARIVAIGWHSHVESIPSSRGRGC